MLQVRQATLVGEGINVDRTEADMKVTVINANATAKGIEFTNQAAADIANNTVTYQGEAYGYAKQKVGLSTNSQMLDYVYYLNLMGVKDSGAKLLVGLDSTLVDIGR